MKVQGWLGLVICSVGAAFFLWGISAWWMSPPAGTKRELDPLALVQAGLTLLVGFYLTQYLSLRNSERKVEKDVVIQQVRESLIAAHLSFEALQSLTDASTQQILVSRLKVTQIRIEDLGDLLSECEMAEGDLGESFKHIDKTCIRYWRCATKDAPLPPGDRVLADDAYRDLRSSLARLIIKVNRCR